MRVTMDAGPHHRRVIRRELDRLAGELLRRQSETDACLALFARRERLNTLFCRRVGWWRSGLELAQWFVS